MNGDGSVLGFELEPFTVLALKLFRDGNDQNLPEAQREVMARQAIDMIDDLTLVERGSVIIDLLTLCDLYRQAINVMQVNEIEKGMQ